MDTLVRAALLSVALPLVALLAVLRVVRQHARAWLARCRRGRVQYPPLRSVAAVREERELACTTAQSLLTPDEHMYHPSLVEPATVIAAKLRSRVYSSEAVVSAHIRQSQRVNGCLNAIAERRYHTALAEARAADALLAASTAPLPPFCGVPCSMKEVLAVEGMLHTAGVWSRRALRARGDAEVVARLKGAGFIIIATTNVSELCMWYESNNTVYGRTHNAYDHARMVGGSSGGEGALISAGGAPVGVGSDIGGSIRMPAAFNGVWGHKPTGGMVPNTGQYPITPHGILVTGPITRAAVDLWPCLCVMRGPDHVDPACRNIVCVDVDPAMLPARSASAAEVTPSRPRTRSRAGSGVPPDAWLRVTSPTRVITAWSQVTVFTLSSTTLPPRLSTRVEASIASGVNVASQALVDRLGCTGVHPFHLPEMLDAFDMWAAVMASHGSPTFAELMQTAYDGKLHLPWELLRWCCGVSKSTLPALILALIEPLVPALAPARHAAFIRAAQEVRRRVSDALAAANGVLLLPVHPTTASMHDVPLLRPFNVGYTQMFNTLELPATVAPVGLDADGMPVAVQIVGAHGYDRLTIAVAEALEDAGVAGWLPPDVARCPGAACGGSRR